MKDPGAIHTVSVGLALVVAALVSGCATTTSPSRGTEIASELRTSRNVDGLISSDTRAQQHFVRGLTQAQIGNHGAALDHYSEALRLAPNTAAVLSAAAESHTALGDESSALFYARQARDADAENIHYHFQLAQLHLAADEPRRAAHIYTALHERFPRNPDVLYHMARVQIMMGDYEDAIVSYETLLGEIGADRDVQKEILHLLGRLGDVEGQERMLTEMLETDPHNSDVRKMLSEIYLEQGNAQAAAEQLEKVVSEQPGNAEALLDLAHLYRDRDMADSADAVLERLVDLEATGPSQLLTQAATLYGRAAQDENARRTAVQLLERVLELDPENADALVMLGDIRLMQERYHDGGDLLYRSLATNPRDQQIWIQSAGAFLEAGDFEKAAAVADEGLVLFPGSLPLLRVAGYALMNAYHNREAVERFQTAVHLIADDPSEGQSDLSHIHSALGLLYDRIGELDASDEAYENAIAADADNVAALNNYAYSLAERGVRLDQALKLAQRAVEVAGPTASFLDTLGWIHFKRGEYDEALAQLERASALEGASSTLFEHLGDVHDALGNADHARSAWQKALEMDPESTSVKSKLAGQ